MSINKVILVGNLGKDPEISYTKNNLAVCKFSIATTKRKKDGSDVTQWHSCTAFDKRGETIEKYVSKGNMIYIEGELNYNKVDDKIYTNIIVNEFCLLPNNKNQVKQNDDIPF